MTAGVVVLAVGNPSRGDDALGPVLAGRLADWLAAEGLAGAVEVIEDFQLQIEHALDLVGRSLVLFIDAGVALAEPFTFRRIAPAAGRSHSSHALAPAAVLQVFVQTTGQQPPPAYVLGVRGESFELGAEMSRAASANAEAALAWLVRLCRRATAADWDSFQR